MAQYQTIGYGDLGAGIDQQAAESALKEGFSEDLLDTDPRPEGNLSKRKGYQSHLGLLPMRVQSVTYHPQSPGEYNLCFRLDGSIQLGNVRSSPVLVQGRSSNIPDVTADFKAGTDSIHWYPEFRLEFRYVFSPGLSSVTIAGTDHGLGSNLYVDTSEATNLSNLSNSIVQVESVSINTATSDVTITVENTSSSDVELYIYLTQKSAVTGQTYIHTAAGPTSSVTITQATHQLASNDYQFQIYEESAGVRTRVWADEAQILANGNFTATFSESLSNLIFILSVTENKREGTLDPGSSLTVQLTDLQKPFLHVTILEEFPGYFQEVLPDSIDIDSAAGTADVTFTSTAGSGGGTFKILWEETDISINELCVQSYGDVAAIRTDSAPQLTLWGIPHEGQYSTEASALRGGWANHLDSYRAEEEAFLVSGLGGNLFREAFAASEDWNFPTFLPNIRGRVQTGRICTPLFWGVGQPSSGTRTIIQAPGAEEHWASIQSIEHAPTFLEPSRMLLSIQVAPGQATTGIDTSAAVGDLVTVRQAGWSRNSGTFKILDAAISGSILELGIRNDRSGADWNEPETGAQAAVFTDRIQLQSNSNFLKLDVLLSSALQDRECTVQGSSGTTVLADGFDEPTSIGVGQRLGARRTSYVLPLQTLSGVESVENLVRMDVLRFQGINRNVQALSVNPAADQSFSIVSADGTTATASVTSTANFTVGQKLLLIRCSDADLDGVIQIQEIVSETQFSFLSSIQGTPTGTIKGYTVELDENLEVQDDPVQTIEIQVPGRWVPVEAPDGTGTALPTTRYRYWTGSAYENAEFLRSVMVQDNLYIQAASDSPKKFDGVNLYRAGLPRWQPHLFVTTIATPYEFGTITGISGSSTFSYYFRLNAVDQNQNVIASAVTGAEDARITLSSAAQVRIRGVGMPVWDDYDWNSISVQIYRTKANGSTFYLVGEVPLQWDTDSPYFEFVDTRADSDLLPTQTDPLQVLFGTFLGTTIRPPMQAKYVTSIENRLVQANFLGDPTLDIRFIETGPSISSTALSGKSFLFRKQNTDTLTSSNLEDRQRYQFVTSGEISITGITATTTQITVSASTLPVAGNWVYLFRHGTPHVNNRIRFAGWYRVASVGVGNFVIDCQNPGTGTTSWSGTLDVDAFVTLPNAVMPVWLGQDSNYGMLNGNTSGAAYQFLAMRRLANAINTSMRFAEKPWMIAEAGNEYGFGQLVVRQPKAPATSIEVELPTFNETTEFRMSVNDVLRSSGSQAGALQQRFGSRILASYQNYPEIMDNPEAVVESESDSVIDVNSADGQEITGVIPFFGESSFGASSTSEVLVVFKTNSIYVVNVSLKSNPTTVDSSLVQRLDSRGLGCTAPASISVARDGIFFANESGMYKLTRSLKVEYVGRKMERLWKQLVNKDRLDLAQGHHYPSGQQYKLSLPVDSDNRTSQVFVYDHTREGQADGYAWGSWTRYRNHPATGWCNLLEDAYFSSQTGEVLVLRRAGDKTDFRDKASPIQMDAVLRALDGGDGAIRKVIRAVVVQFRTGEGQELGTKILTSTDLQREFLESDRALLQAGTQDGLSSSQGQTVRSIRFSPQNQKGVQFQVRIQNDSLDEGPDIARVELRMAGLSHLGVQQAKTAGRVP